MPKKIFELAKELDMKPLDLVEDLKSRGYAVRNHMSSLQDNEVEDVLTAMAKEREEAEAASDTTKSKTKKKVTKKKKAKAKKKTASKKVVTVKDADELAAEAADKASKKKSGVTRRKKAVIRKKAGQEEMVAAETESEVVSEVSETLLEETQDTGLRVVSVPEKKKEEDSGTKEVYKEKVHKFTPVYIPEKEETAAASDDEDVSFDEDDDDKKESKDSKRRLGGLATMMSGKKANVSKSQVLQQTRADTELKSYAALSGTGRPIYTTVKKKKQYAGPSKGTNITEVKDSKRIIKLHHGATAVQLAKKLKIKLKEMVDKCLDLNLLIKAEDFFGIKLASEIAALYDYRVEDVSFNEDEVIGKKELSDTEKEKLPLRDPIITIMGHVDHGKTTLLDYIREANVVQGEAGGITQHIGAYSVKTKTGKKLTFLDTPGHAAFGSMRQRGANVTDIVILVVAADDGVMPQTRESIRFIENADVPMIVAINKMDKESANPDRVKQELTEFNITPEEWGGTTQMVPVSALKGTGVDDLLEAVALQAEIMELRADPKGQAEGVVIESKVEPGRGPVATILIQTGTLKKSDSIVVGETFGRARNLMDHTGKQLKSAGPSIPVQILGLNEAPNPGDIMNVVKNEREAKKIVDNRIEARKKLDQQPNKKHVSLEDFFAMAAGEGQEAKALNLIIRSDVLGSYEAIKQSLEPLSNKEVEVKIIGGGVGPINDNDVQLADSANGIIIGFNMRPATTARRLAEEKGIDVKTYSIIYELINDVKLALEGMLEPEYVEKFIGRAEVKETFTVPKVGTIAGSIVVDGSIKTGCNIRLLRDGKIMFDGKMSSLKRFKDDAKEVKNGLECGIGLENYNDIKVGDLFEAYMLDAKKRTLDEVAKEEARREAAAAKDDNEVRLEHGL